MNSSNEVPINGFMEDVPSTSQLSGSDSNANLSQNRGAIPKTKVSKPAGSKKSTKINNNHEEVLPKPSISDDVLQMHSDVLRLNGFSDQFSRISSSYLDDYKTVLYRNTDVCGCTSKNLIDGNYFSAKDELCEPPCKIASYQTTNSSNEANLKDDSSSEDNELLSISDDGCIYTYKGDQAADLPSSFFSLDIPAPRSPSPQRRQETASPEMDFLEMDFDPGPSGDADSDSQSHADLENAENLPPDSYNETNMYINKFDDPMVVEGQLNKIPTSKAVQPLNLIDCPMEDIVQPSPSSSVKQDSPISSITERIRKMRMPWSCSFNQRTTHKFGSRLMRRHHNSNGELTSPVDKLVSPSEEFGEKVFERSDSFPTEKTFIWTEEEAFRKQITQIGASACGATAILNVLNALRFPLPSVDCIKEAVNTRLRANSSPLTEYLLSRSVAGSSHEDLIEGLHKLTDGQIYARFFHMYPERVVNLHSWLHFWISHGAVPIATLNLQKCIEPIPDAWHHQMIFGVGSKGIYLTNPFECVDAQQLWLQLSSESVLLIRKEDVLLRWNVKTDLDQLIKIKDRRWSQMNVVGQIANLIRESTREKRLGFATTSHIKIPAAYSSGITLVMRVDAPLCPLLQFCPELPILPSQEEAAGCSDVFY